MLRRMMIATAALGCLIALPAGAEVMEIGLNFGTAFGGSLDNPATSGNIDIDNSQAYGATIDVDINDRLQFELLWSHRDTQMDNAFVLFPTPKIDLGIDHYQAGVLIEGATGTDTHPYLGVAVGVTELSPESGLSGDSRGSFSVGIGVKHFVTDYFAFRAEGRVFGVLVDQDTIFCESNACAGYGNSGIMWLYDLKIGVSVAF